MDMESAPVSARVSSSTSQTKCRDEHRRSPDSNSSDWETDSDADSSVVTSKKVPPKIQKNRTSIKSVPKSINVMDHDDDSYLYSAETRVKRPVTKPPKSLASGKRKLLPLKIQIQQEVKPKPLSEDLLMPEACSPEASDSSSVEEIESDHDPLPPASSKRAVPPGSSLKRAALPKASSSPNYSAADSTTKPTKLKRKKTPRKASSKKLSDSSRASKKRVKKKPAEKKSAKSSSSSASSGACSASSSSDEGNGDEWEKFSSASGMSVDEEEKEEEKKKKKAVKKKTMQVAKASSDIDSYLPEMPPGDKTVKKTRKRVYKKIVRINKKTGEVISEEKQLIKPKVFERLSD